MKKTYIQPTVKMHSVNTSRMVAGSFDYSNAPTTGDNSIDTNDAKDDFDFGW